MGERPCVAVAFSGGRDSTALLHVVLRQAAASGLRVAALHVHHGLQPRADAWLAQLRRRCAGWARQGAPLEFDARRLPGQPGPGESVEAWARRGRYAALAEMANAAGCSLVLLAHHRRDQAETFLLQALRGGGAAGLSGMPATAMRDGLTWARPWLHLPREAIESYVRRHRLRFIDDASNDDPRYARNRLRLQVWPALTGAFTDAEACLVAAATRAQQEAACLVELAQADLADIEAGDGLLIDSWCRLSVARRANALRAWLRRRCGAGPAEPFLQRLLKELPAGAAPARWPGEGGELRRYRGVLRWWPEPASDRSEPHATPLRITSPGRYAVPSWQGVLHVLPVAQGGVALSCLAGAQLRPRAGGERFQRGARGVARSLKKQYQAAGLAAWERNAPLLYGEGGELVFVPGLGIDGRALAPEGVPQVMLRWEPTEGAPGATPGKP
ncbi:tRNA lysidine(34) synthetase TilS [Ideonella sp. BN130291]|uniref:tRNA lysidine(34) synthetase TilS n=1 Tax=Ideonella sp. BN130291 TaxID=3112940 RepID=UPI002E270A7E|nr:tRNA lysidine(34) synthetase TilS [Ideonella sp. BN130291]